MLVPLSPSLTMICGNQMNGRCEGEITVQTARKVMNKRRANDTLTKKRIRKKEESEETHTTLDLNPFLIKYPRNDVEYSYERFKLNQQKKGVKSDDVTAEAAAFEMWLMSDLKYEKKLRAPEVNKKVTRHCPNKHGFVEVLAKDEYKGVFCEKCDYQMVHVSELVKAELLPF